MATSNRPHALMLPFPETGHINPLMQLARYLASSHGFIVTFVNTEYNHRRIVQANPSHLPSDHGLDIRLLPIPDGLSDGDNRDSDVPIMVKIIENVGPVLEELICSINAQGPHPVTAIVSDVIAFSTIDVAKKLGIPRVGFWPPNASVHAYVCHASLRGPPDFDQMACYPGLPPLPGSKLPWITGNQDEAAAIFCSVKRNAIALHDSEWVLCNSVHELEPTVQDLLPSGYTKVCPVGPILPSELLENPKSRIPKGISTSMWVEQDDCLEWLDVQDPSSVMYVSVGSFAPLNAEQLLELALGLEASGVPILWVLRADLRERISFPEGFMERNEGRIRIIEWCPQLLVLSHAAIGSFLTHCGWNSVIEAMAMGVPLLTWPQTVDQFLNAELVVGTWGVGMKLGHGFVSRGTVESCVKNMMAADNKKARSVRDNAAEKRRVILQAVSERGSSHVNMLKFVQWMRLQAQSLPHV